MSRRATASSMKGLAGWIAAAVLLAAGAAGCARNPATGKMELSLVSQSQEVAMGRESDVAIQQEYGVYPDARLAAYVDSIGQALAKRSERPDLEWHFRVLDSPVVNAFALPGGYVYVTRGLLAVMNSEAQLAAVMGHEVGHVAARHGARQMTRATIGQVGLAVGGVLSSDIARYSGLASQGMGLLFLKYGRDDENQADELGVRYATRAGWDPREMPATFVTLRIVSERSGGGRLPTFLSTHPDPGDREQRTTTLAETAVGQLSSAERGALAVRAPNALAHLKGVVYGDDPRQGYLEGRMFYHPDLSFQMEWPTAWTVMNGPTAVVAQRSDQSAQMQLTLVSGTSPDAYRVALADKGVTSSDGRNETIAGKQAWIGRLTTKGQSGTQVFWAAFVQREGQSMFQLLGAPGDASLETSFLATARSIRSLTDPAKKAVTPARIDLRQLQTKSTLEGVLDLIKDLSISHDDIAMINNKALDDPLPPGRIIKIVRKF